MGSHQGRIQDLWKGGGAAATASAAGAKVFGGSRLKTLFGISKGGARAPCAPPPESASGHVVYQCQWCLSVRDREKDIETKDRQMNRTWERGSLARLFRENIKTFLNDILRHVGMIPDSVDQMLAGMYSKHNI